MCTKDSCDSVYSIDILKEKVCSSINYNHEEESGLKRQIGALQSVTEMQWLEKHIPKHVLISEEILTNIKEHGTIIPYIRREQNRIGVKEV